jgi:hypothetical protein
MLMSDPCHTRGVSALSLIKYFWIFSRISCNRMLLIRESTLQAELFPSRKSIIIDIPGFPAGDGGDGLAFLTVY